MSSVRLAHLIWLAGVSLALPLASGCLMPVQSQVSCETRGVSLGSDPREYAGVHAFRVDITVIDDNRPDPPAGAPYVKPEEVHCLREVTPARDEPAGQTAAALVPAQRITGWCTGYELWIPLLGNKAHRVEPRVALALYRPGYELIVIKPGDPVDGIAWKPAVDPLAQAQAIDGLFNPGVEPFALKPGSASAGHRAALLFGAAEYDRLALLVEKGPSSNRQLVRHLREKANKLRDLAER